MNSFAKQGLKSMKSEKKGKKFVGFEKDRGRSFSLFGNWIWRMGEEGKDFFERARKVLPLPSHFSYSPSFFFSQLITSNSLA